MLATPIFNAKVASVLVLISKTANQSRKKRGVAQKQSNSELLKSKFRLSGIQN